MKSIQQVLWRGALALGLMAVGLGSGIGMPPIERSASLPADCPTTPRALAADQPPGNSAGQHAGAIFVRRLISPAG